jgi:hypothetical protein
MMAKNALATQTDRESGWELIRLLFQPPEINLQDSIVNAEKAEAQLSHVMQQTQLPMAGDVKGSPGRSPSRHNNKIFGMQGFSLRRDAV